MFFIILYTGVSMAASSQHIDLCGVVDLTFVSSIVLFDKSFNCSKQ